MGLLFSDAVQVLVEGLDGRTFTAMVELDLPVAAAKEVIAEKSGVPSSAFRLQHAQRELCGEQTLAAVGVCSGSVLMMKGRLHGGMMGDGSQSQMSEGTELDNALVMSELSAEGASEFLHALTESRAAAAGEREKRLASLTFEQSLSESRSVARARWECEGGGGSSAAVTEAKARRRARRQSGDTSSNAAVEAQLRRCGASCDDAINLDALAGAPAPVIEIESDDGDGPADRKVLVAGLGKRLAPPPPVIEIETSDDDDRLASRPVVAVGLGKRLAATEPSAVELAAMQVHKEAVEQCTLLPAAHTIMTSEGETEKVRWGGNGSSRVVVGGGGGGGGSGGGAVAVEAPAISMRRQLAQLPRELHAREAKYFDGLDAEQRLGVSAMAHGLMVGICGPPGHGKTHSIGQGVAALVDKHTQRGGPAQVKAVVGVGPTHVARRVQEAQVVRQGLAMEVETGTLAARYGIRLGEAYDGARIAGLVARDPQRAKARDTYAAHAVWVDEAGQVDPDKADAIDAAARRLRGNAAVMGGQQLVLSLDLSQNLPVKAGAERSNLSLRRLIFESDLFVRGAFWLIVLKTPYRNRDPRMLTVLDDLACERCSVALVDFVREAARVDMPEDASGRTAVVDRPRHLVTSNTLRDSLGRTKYLQAGPSCEAVEYEPPELQALEVNRRQAVTKAFKDRHASNYTIGPMVIRRGEAYYFSAGTAEEVNVDGVTLSKGEEIHMRSWHDGAHGVVWIVCAVEQGDIEVTLEPVELCVQGMVERVSVPPFLYGRVMSSYKSQAREFRCVWCYCGGLQGEDNQLLTMISRGMGSPWEGTLKVTGISLAEHKGSVPDLEKKMRQHKKSLLVAKLLGKEVDPAKYAAVRSEVVAADPHWLEVEKAIDGRVLSM